MNQPAKGPIKRIVLYLGDDNSYWESITQRYQTTYPDSKFEYQSFYDKKLSYQDVFLNVLEIRPIIIYIDLSMALDYNMRLAQFISRDNGTAHIPLIGLVDKKELLRDCIYAGMDFIHVKCGEYHDVVYDPLRLAFPKEAKAPQFAKAKLKDKESILIDDFRLSYITPTGIHIEGNCHLDEGSSILIENQIPKSIVPSQQFFVKKAHNSNFFYDYAYGYDLDFKFIDPPIYDDEEEKGDQTSDEALKKLKSKDLSRKQKDANFQNELQIAKKKLKQWVVANMADQSEKKTKILVVDKTLDVLKKSVKPLDQYDSVIRFQSTLTQELEEINRLRPNIIAFSIDEFRESEAIDMKEEVVEQLKDRETQSLNTLSNIIQFSKSLDKYNPFIVLFNCTKFTSKSFQESYRYPLLLTNKERLSLELVLNLSTMYEQKQEKKTNELIMSKIQALKKENPTKYARLNMGDFKETRYIFSKKNALAAASITYPIKILSLSESEITFSTEALLKRGVYRMNFPTPMSVTIIPDKATGKLYLENRSEKTYEGLLHSVDENDKKKIRQFVNEIFFSGVNEKREKEATDYAKVHTQAFKKKMAEQGVDVDAPVAADDSEGQDPESGNEEE